MQSKDGIAYRKLLSFYTALVTLTGLASILMFYSPKSAPCGHYSGAAGSTPVAYLCSSDGAAYIVQLMVYALGLSLGCLLLVFLMQKASRRRSH
jgi:hypothetical protein